MIHRVVPLLDHRASQPGVMHSALDWAIRLRVPIQALSLPVRVSAASGRQEQIWREICSRHAVSWNLTRCPRRGIYAIDDLLKAGDLFLFSQGLQLAEKQFLFRQAKRGNGPAVLICPDVVSAVPRLLFVHQNDRVNETTLAAVISHCRSLEAQLVVLTLARSEQTAQQLQNRLKEIVADQRYPADFDFWVGCDLRNAVARVSQWRRSTHVIVESAGGIPWWRRFRDDTADWLLSLSATLTLLAIPEKSTPSQFEMTGFSGLGGRAVGSGSPVSQLGTVSQFASVTNSEIRRSEVSCGS